MERTKINNLSDHTGKTVEIYGWINSRRDHGKLAFFDIRDASGYIQTVAKGDIYEETEDWRPEWVVKVAGKVEKRPDNMANEDEENGNIELSIEKVEVLNQANTPPFAVNDDTAEVDEKKRMAHRYLDLRSQRMQKNVRKRHRVIKFFRDHLTEKDFIEIETPILGKSTPEGARDYLVPSRTHPGKFYALPQSPQQYKQLLMVSGIERYFQIARAFRDEDTRKDRQPEHTQLDIEMSFTSPEKVMSLVEEMVNAMMEKLYPNKKIRKPWPRISYEQAMEKYGNDKPDLREDKNNPNEIAFGWVVDFPQFEENKETGKPTPTHHMFVKPKENSLDLLDKNPMAMTSTQYDWICNGFELASGSMRISDPELQLKIMEIIGINQEEAQQKFGHLLEAFEYGAPPHGGIAPGIDRLVMILQNEPNIREVMAFPKTGDGRDLLMGAPSKIKQSQLEEIGLELKKEDE